MALIDLDLDQAEQAIGTLARVTEALSLATAAIRELNGVPHGGITVEIVGETARVIVAPS